MCLSVTERGFRMTEFGQLLKSLRERRGVSQSKLAERAEFDHSYVSRLEGGARMPTRDAVDRLGDAMDLSEGERDMLLAAAGFLPRDFAKILSAEPVLGEVFYLLSDEQIPAEYRENMRQVLHLARRAGPYRHADLNAWPRGCRRRVAIRIRLRRRLRADGRIPASIVPEPFCIHLTGIRRARWR